MLELLNEVQIVILTAAIVISVSMAVLESMRPT